MEMLLPKEFAVMASNLFNLASRAAAAIRSLVGRGTTGNRTVSPAPAATPRPSFLRRAITPSQIPTTPRQMQELARQIEEITRRGTQVEEDPNAPWEAVGGRRGQDNWRSVDVRNGRSVNVDQDNPLFTGEMIPVTSSNVHSIGFVLDGMAQGQSSQGNLLRNQTGTLLIRFLEDQGGGVKSGPGPLYEYQDVPASLFIEFQNAASKGTFIWDNIRVRGTVSGHKFAYDFAGSPNGYIPRQAAVKRGAAGQHYLSRTFQGHKSQLGNQQVTRSGPNPAKGATTGGVRGAGQGTNRGGVAGLNFIPGSGRSR